MDETRIDAAQTPAHVFAYRAFRSVFVRSPDTSPVRGPERYNDNKENAKAPIRASRFSTSPINTKRKEPVQDLPPISFTPKKQKTIPVSPSKSILKNPGALTPRRAGLRDVTVTFKDLRKSASPELTRQSARTKQQSQPSFEISRAMKPLEKDATGTEVPELRKELTKAQSQKVSAAPMPQAPASKQDFDLDVYKAQTEKEMRRLIKYGHKWKEQARKQEVETAKLKGRLEDLQKQNEKLQKKLDERNIREAQATEKATRSTRLSSDQPKLRSSRESTSSESKDLQQNGKSRNREDATSVVQAKIDEAYAPREFPARKPQDLQPDAAAVNPVTQPRITPAPCASSPQDTEHGRVKFGGNDKTDRACESHREPVLLVKRSKLTQSEPIRLSEAERNAALPLRSASALGPAKDEDRFAAARARLEKRRLARGVSAQVAPSTTPKSSSKPVRDSSVLGKEESQVDWLAV